MENIEWNCITTENGNTCTIQNIDPILTPYFSSGDIMISILLLLLFLIELIKLLRFSIGKIKVTREYQGNNSQEGKEFYQI